MKLKLLVSASGLQVTDWPDGYWASTPFAGRQAAGGIPGTVAGQGNFVPRRPDEDYGECVSVFTDSTDWTNKACTETVAYACEMRACLQTKGDPSKLPILNSSL